MERKTRRRRHAAAALMLAVIFAAAGSSRSGAPARATDDGLAGLATSNDGEAVSAPSFGLLLDEPTLPVTIDPSNAVVVLGTEQTASTSTTTLAPTTAAPTTLTPTTLTPTTLTPTTAAATTTTPATITPTTLPPPITGRTPEERGRRALDRISYDWVGRLPGWTITFSPGRSGVFGYTYVGDRRIEIFVRETMDDDLLTHVVAHELGHAVDVTFNSSDDRTVWAAARGIDSVQWWPGDGVTDFSTGAGDFAEAFAVWQIGSGNYRGRAASVPTDEQLSLVATFANR